MTVLQALGALLGLLLPSGDPGCPALLAAAAAAGVLLLLARVLQPARWAGAAPVPATSRFADVRVHLGASAPDAAGHRRARAPGARG